MRALFLVAALLGVACAGTHAEPNVPPIAVNQSGLGERLLKASPEPQAAEEVPATPPKERVVEAEMEPRESPRRPEPESSGERVAFRRSEGETAAQPQTAKAPPELLRPDRDPRRVRFEARHEDRLRRAADE